MGKQIHEEKEGKEIVNNKKQLALALCVLAIFVMGIVLIPQSIPNDKEGSQQQYLGIPNIGDSTNDDKLQSLSNDRNDPINYTIWLVWSGGSYSANLTVRITHPYQGEVFTTEYLEIRWEVIGHAKYFEVFINGTSRGTTTNTFLDIVTPETDFELKVVGYGYDEDELAWDSLILQKIGEGKWERENPSSKSHTNPITITRHNIINETQPLRAWVKLENGDWHQSYNLSDLSLVNPSNVVFYVIETPYGFVGFYTDETDTEFGHCPIVYTPILENGSYFKQPTGGVFLKLWVKAGGEWYEKYITDRNLGYDYRQYMTWNIIDEKTWELGWNITNMELSVAGYTRSFDIYVGIRVHQDSKFADIKQTITPHNDYQDMALEWQFLTAPHFVDTDFELSYVRVGNENISKEFPLSKFYNMTQEIPDFVDSAQLVSKNNIPYHTFNFDDLESQGLNGTKLFKIENMTLPDSSNQHVCRVGVTKGSSINANESLVIDPQISISDEGDYHLITTGTYSARFYDAHGLYYFTINGNARCTVETSETVKFTFSVSGDGIENLHTLTFTTQIIEDDSDIRVVLKGNYSDSDWGGTGVSCNVTEYLYFYEDYCIKHTYFDAEETIVQRKISAFQTMDESNSTFSKLAYGNNDGHTTYLRTNDADFDIDTSYASFKYNYTMYYNETSINEVIAFKVIYDEAAEDDPTAVVLKHGSTKEVLQIDYSGAEFNTPQSQYNYTLAWWFDTTGGGQDPPTYTVVDQWNDYLNDSGAAMQTPETGTYTGWDQEEALYELDCSGNSVKFDLDCSTNAAGYYPVFKLTSYTDTEANFKLELEGVEKTKDVDYVVEVNETTNIAIVWWNSSVISSDDQTFEMGVFGGSVPTITYVPYPSNNSHLDWNSVNLNWTVDTAGTFWIYRNGTQISSGSYTDQVNYTWSPNGLSASVYNITLKCMNASSNNATNSIFFTIHAYTKYDNDVKLGVQFSQNQNRTYAIEVLDELDANLVMVFLWDKGQWVDLGDGEYPGHADYTELLQDYIDAGYEVWLNIELVFNQLSKGQYYNGTAGSTIAQHYQCKIDYIQQNATAGGDIQIDLSEVSGLNTVNATTTGEYWSVYDDTDNQLLAYGTSTEQWNYTAASGNVTIHSTTANHNYSVYYIYNQTSTLSLASSDIQTWTLYILDMLLSNHSYQLTGIEWESIGCVSGGDFSPHMQEEFKDLTSMTVDLKALYNANWYNDTWQEYYNATSYVYANAIKDIQDLLHDYNMVGMWYEGGRNNLLSPEWMTWAGMDCYNDWFSNQDTQVTVRGNLWHHQWEADDNTMEWGLAWYPDETFTDEFCIAQAKHFADGVTGGCYPDHFFAWSTWVAGDDNCGVNYGGWQSYPELMTGTKYWFNMIKTINYAFDLVERYDVANVSIANIFPAIEVDIPTGINFGGLWDVPVKWDHVNINEINDTQSVPSDVDLIWLIAERPYESAGEGQCSCATNTTLEALESFVTNGGALIISGDRATMECLNGTQLAYMLIRDLLGVDYNGTDIARMTRTSDGDSHWITQASGGLPANFDFYNGNDQINEPYSPSLATTSVLYNNTNGNLGVLVGTLGSGRMGFATYFYDAAGDHDEVKWDEQDLLMARICAWVSQNEDNYVWLNVTNLSRDDANNIFKRLYYNSTEDKFVIGIFNSGSSSKSVQLEFNSTVVSLTSAKYVLFDPIAMDGIGNVAYHSRSGDMIQFTTTISNRSLALIIGKPYGSVLHIWSNRTFVSESWNPTTLVYTLSVTGDGYSVISVNDTIGNVVSVTDDGSALTSYGSLDDLAAASEGYYHNTAKDLLYVKTSGSTIQVTLSTATPSTVTGGGPSGGTDVPPTAEVKPIVKYKETISPHENQTISVTVKDGYGKPLSDAIVYIEFEGQRYRAYEGYYKGVYEVEIPTQGLEQGDYYFEVEIYATHLDFKNFYQKYVFHVTATGDILTSEIMEVGGIRITGLHLLIVGGFGVLLLFANDHKPTKRRLRRTKEKIKHKYRKHKERKRRQQ